MQERIHRNLKCPKCGTEWESRVKEPRECPHCKKRLDWSRPDRIFADMEPIGESNATNDNNNA